MDISASLLLCCTALLWGGSDALMKVCAPSLLDSSSHTSLARRLLSDFLLLLSSPRYLACLLCNQAGSLLYYYSLTIAPLSLASPVVNTGKIVVNAVVGQLVGESSISPRKGLGLLLIATGILLHISDIQH